MRRSMPEEEKTTEDGMEANPSASKKAAKNKKKREKAKQRKFSSGSEGDAAHAAHAAPVLRTRQQCTQQRA